MADLPSELIAEILSRLPVKPLLRFRSVSKPWCALIDSPYFIKTHLNRSMQATADHSLILRDTTEPRLYSLALHSLERAIELDHPLNPQKNHQAHVWGSCNGLVCLSNADYDVVLWNPSTKRYHNLPAPPVDNPRSYVFKTVVYGFGYDSKSDDYKVVRILQFRSLKPMNDSEVSVYSLKSNSWIRVLNIPFYLELALESALLTSGALHWDAEDGESSLIVAFDLASNGYYILPQPEYEYPNFDFLSLGVLDGCLCVLCSYFEASIDMWVMKEYGVKESWAKLISIKTSITVKFFDELKPVTYSKDGEKVLFHHEAHRFFWYDLESKMIENVGTCDLPDEFELIVCLGSLVPLGSDGKKQVSQVEKKRKINGKKQDMIFW